MQINFCNEWRNVLSKWIIMSHSFWMNFPWRSSMTWMLFSQTKQIISDTSSTKITDGHWNHYSSVVASSPALLWPLIKQQPASSLFCPQQSRRRTACWWFSAWGASPWVGGVNDYWQRKSDKFEWHAGLGQRKFIGAWCSSDLVLPMRSQRESQRRMFFPEWDVRMPICGY